ncbi:hypothetical protein WEN_02970 [Mycoplasma wenyonii str. Massachusetts]|uniref:Uncharacterized protein n=2 Tax=Mycoplasma wenyonii TaxID=65123 RepID=I6ZFI5_MYCWM|nr:hypothetical protein WEN_02970 [Mycoplasma wenyonii str. Massachusetts]
MEEMAADRGKGAKGTNGLGCFWIPGFPAELFFCFDKGELGSAPYLFHYSWRGNRGERAEDKLQKVENIVRGGSSVHLKKGSQRAMSGKTKLLMGWTHKWPEQTPFDPGKHCVITQNENKNYKVACTSPVNSGQDKWEKEIPASHIVEPNNSEIKRVSE